MQVHEGLGYIFVTCLFTVTLIDIDISIKTVPLHVQKQPINVYIQLIMYEYLMKRTPTGNYNGSSSVVLAVIHVLLQ